MKCVDKDKCTVVVLTEVAVQGRVAHMENRQSHGLVCRTIAMATQAHRGLSTLSSYTTMLAFVKLVTALRLYASLSHTHRKNKRSAIPGNNKQSYTVHILQCKHVPWSSYRPTRSDCRTYDTVTAIELS